MAEHRIITIMSAFELVEDKLESLKVIINAGMIDIKIIEDYTEIVHHLISSADSIDDIDIITKELITIFGLYMAAININTNEILTLYDFIADGTIDLISEYGLIIRNEFLKKLKHYGCKSIHDLSNDQYEIILRQFEFMNL